MKNKKRILAAVLTAVMMISMLPATAFATETVGNEKAESAVEAVTMSSEEQDVETTVEYVEEETNETTTEVPSEADPGEESAEPADEAEAVAGEEEPADEAEAVTDEAEPADKAKAATEEAVPAAEKKEGAEAVQEEPAETEDQIVLRAGGDGSGFPNTVRYSSTTYSKSGDPVALATNFRIQGLGQTNWLNKYDLNGQTVKTDVLYAQAYVSGTRTIYVYELPSLIEVMRGYGLYISPESFRYGDLNGAGHWETFIIPIFVDPLLNFNSIDAVLVQADGNTDSANNRVVNSIKNGNVTYCIFENYSGTLLDPTVEATYYVQSGSDQEYVRPTYHITYKDGLNGEVFADQFYQDENAVEGHKTPHFQWNGANGDPERYGYRFAGWKDESGTVVGNSNDVAEITIAGDAIYTATWEKVSVTVTKEVLCGVGVNREDVEHTVTFALWDPSENRYVTTDGNPGSDILTKSIIITPDGVSGTAVFGVDEMIPGHKLDLMEMIQVNGDWTELNPTNSKFENAAGMELYVSGTDIYVNGLPGNDIIFTGGKDVTAKVVNTYSADESEHKFVVNKKWVDYKGDDIIDGTGYTATMTLYQKVGDGEPQAFGTPIVLDGTADENGESEAWKATFSNLPYRVGEETCTYMVKETACTEGFKAYDAKEDTEPMTGYKERSGGYIYNKQDYFILVHTSDNSEEKLPLGQYDLTTKLKDASSQLYGGYYYYDENNNKVFGTVNGMAFTTPADTKPGTKYYLREVSGTYLKPSIYLIQNPTHNGLIQGLYGFVNVDDATAYEQSGLIVNDTEMPISDYASSVEVTRENGNYYTTLKASDFGGGVIGFTDLRSLIVGKSKHVIKAYFITKDHIKVTGFKYRKLQFAANDERYDAPIWTGWYPNGNTLSGLVKDNERTYEAASSAGGFGAAKASRVLPVLTIGAPSETLSYTITKVYDSAAEEQVVEEGNRTGEITYAAKNGYYFAGWYTDEAFTVPADFADVNSNMTVYAKYVSAKEISASFSRKSQKSGTTTFNATVSVKGQMNLNNVTVTTDGNAASVLGNTSVTKTGSGKNVKYTTKYKGTAAVKGLSLIDSFTVSIAWTTADGTAVTGPAYNCRYSLGFVSVR